MSARSSDRSAFPCFATYSSTKFAIRGFSEALRRELVRDRRLRDVRRSAIHSKTSMNQAMPATRMATALKLSQDEPFDVAASVIREIERRRQGSLSRLAREILRPSQRRIPTTHRWRADQAVAPHEFLQRELSRLSEIRPCSRNRFVCSFRPRRACSCPSQAVTASVAPGLDEAILDLTHRWAQGQLPPQRRPRRKAKASAT